MRDNLTEQEKIVLQKLADAYNEFLKLEDKHPMANQEFCHGIHICQYLIAGRVASRVNPEIWNER